MIVHNVLQGSPEWDSLRLGKFTASDFHTFLGNSKTRDTLLLKKAAERLTGRKCDQDLFRSGHTERGHHLETEARLLFQLETGKQVVQAGFIEIDEFTGFSPDGFVEEKAGIEVKCPDNHTFIKISLEDYIAPEYYTQMQFSMHYGARKKWYFVAYNPHFKQPLKIIDVYYDEAKGIQIEHALQRSVAELREIINKLS